MASSRQLPAASRARHADRSRRQAGWTLLIATVVGLWLGIAAPSHTPVAPPPPPAATAPPALPAPGEAALVAGGG